jgi:hypothetical protein
MSFNFNLQDASGSSLRVCCSARTAEVLLLENGGGTATYECTLRGIPAAGGDTSTNNLFVLEYTPQVCMPIYKIFTLGFI